MINLHHPPIQSNLISRFKGLAAATCVVLSGCAPDALTLAPAHPNVPWRLAPNELTASTDAPTTLSTAKNFTLPSVPEVATLSPMPTLSSEHRYSLPELIDIAQRGNPDTHLAWNRAKQAALAVGVAEATFLPRLSANVIGGWQKTHTPLPLLPGNRSIDTELHGVVPALALEWLIFDFGQRKAITDGAKHASYAANVLFNGAHQRIIHDVTQAYYQYGAARSQVKVATQALKNSRLIAEAVEQRRKAGLATVVETAQANQQVAQANLRKVNAKGVEQTAYQVVLASAGLPPTAQIHISEPLNRQLPDTNTVLTDQAISIALSQRPDVLASYAAIKTAESSVAAAEADFMPKVYLGAVAAHNRTNFDMRGLPNLRQQTGSAGVLLGVTIPLYDGGLRAAGLKDAQIQVAKASSIFKKAQQSAMREMMAASDMLRSALVSFSAASELVRTATITYDAALEAYRHGVGTLTAATIAATAQLDAQQARVDARMKSQTAAANLAFAMGRMTSSSESWLD